MAWGNGLGSYTGAILSYTSTTPTAFQNVTLVRGSGTLTGPVLQVQPYRVTGETCYSTACEVSISPPLATAVYVGVNVTNAGTCQLYAPGNGVPGGPMAPDGVSYWTAANGGHATSRSPAIPSSSGGHRQAGTPLTGGTGTSCTAAHADNCGTNFMATQASGVAPFGTPDRRQRDDEPVVAHGLPAVGPRMLIQSAQEPQRVHQPAGSTAWQRRNTV